MDNLLLILCFNNSTHLFISHYVFLSMRIFKWLLIFLPFLPVIVKAQLNYTFVNNISVIEEDLELVHPFSGGFVAPQYSLIDLNFDGLNDLFVYERSSEKVSTFLFIDGKYVYAPRYESLFPANLKNWVLLRDYNCDGKMDLFTSSLFGISLYENISDNELKWSLIHQTIYTEGSNGQINLQVSSLDLPAIVDVDNDGDLDILNFNFATGGGIEFHKNYSVENTGVCDLDLVRTTRRYGDFEECSCETYVFGVDECLTGGREEHSGGRSILSFNNLSSITQDLLIGQEYCILPGYLPNSGTVNEAKMTSVSFDLPNLLDPLRMEFPAFYELDLLNDGTMELIATPNSYVVDGAQDYETLSFLYKKDNQGNYSLVNSNFLKEAMIDVGHKASPVFVDIDFDGDEDLLIGTGKSGNGASIWMYKNTGSASLPSFKLETKDYLDLRGEGNESIKLQIFDIDGNDLPDVILYKSINNIAVAQAILHSGNPISPYSISSSVQLSLPEFSIWDTPYFFKLGSSTGLFIGKQEGNLEYYTTVENLASANWMMVSSNYLGIEKDFTKRNLRVVIADFNANGTEDMLSVNDSGDVLVYDNFLSENSSQHVKGYSKEVNNSFNLNFGNLAIPTTANLYSTSEPALIFGLLQGGLQLLKNIESTEVDNKLDLNVIIYPNPIENQQVLLQPNKNIEVRVLDVTGKVVINPFYAKAGEQIALQLILNEGIYFIEVISEDNEKKVTRIIIVN